MAKASRNTTLNKNLMRDKSNLPKGAGSRSPSFQQPVVPLSLSWFSGGGDEPATWLSHRLTLSSNLDKFVKRKFELAWDELAYLLQSVSNRHRYPGTVLAAWRSARCRAILLLFKGLQETAIREDHARIPMHAPPARFCYVGARHSLYGV
jgi:hypothetical protein